MATQTPNLNLKKPAGTDYVLVGDFNGNADIIDGKIGKLSELTTAVKTSLVLAINEAADRGTYPPYIGENKNWYEWDSATTQYVDSGVVAEGVDGNDGISAYVHIKWSATQPTSDSDMKATPDAYIGIYSGTNSTAPTAYTSYSWYQYKGAKGDTGTAGTGNNWYSGNAITGTSTTPTAYATGITLAQVGDMYMNTGALPDTGRVYKCTLGGNASTALWKYDVLLRGADGAGSGDMLKSTYDTNNDGIVNDSDKLGGVAASGYALEISGRNTLTDIADADYIPMYDTSATVQKKTLWSNIKSVLKTYFDTLYAAITHSHTKSEITDFPSAMTPTAHKSTHATGGGDALTPADIGAAAATHNHDSAYAPKVNIITDTSGSTKTIALAADNTEYRFGTLTSFTFSAIPGGEFECMIIFTTHASGCTVSLPAELKWDGGSAPSSWNAGKVYELSIKSGRAKAGEF